VSLYLAIDGPDGCGKSTQVGILAAQLRDAGRQVVHLREPGSTPLGEHLRTLLLDPTTGELDPLSEALLFCAARQEMLRREVQPALSAGKTVLVERCFFSTLVYQGIVPGDRTGPDLLPVLRQVSERVHADCRPDLVVLLTLSYRASAARRQEDQRQDRIEQRGEDYLRAVHAGYAGLLESQPWLLAFLPRIEMLSAELPRQEIAEQILRLTLACQEDQAR